jgi:NADPH:quinone reductase-like Zn-dependent oxidoreductase
MKYKSVIVTGRGSPKVLQIIENDLRAPLAGEARIKILATGVCQDDIAARIGNRPFLPKIPFVPGYDIVGVVDAIGDGVTEFALGDHVAALTILGGYAEYIYLRQDKLAHVPTALDPAEVATLILNYLVAYQVLHRVAQVKARDRVLIIGASGGVGTAFLQLGKLANLTMYGLASPSKHSALTELGAIPIDYHAQDFVEIIQRAEPNGLDFVFNGMAEEYLGRGLAVLRRGGTLVHYGAPQSFSHFLFFLAKFILFNLLPDGKALKGYGTHRVDSQLLKEDWTKLFTLLEEGKIKPIITARFPILEAAKANELLESGNVIGNVVLVAPELL